jgi:transposase
VKPNESVRYSEAFKLQVVGELEAGKFTGPFAATRAYGIRGSATVTRWLRKYGRSDLMPRKITISTMKEQDEKKALQRRVRELEKALADTHMKELLGSKYLEIACERLGTDVGDFKKKAVTKLSVEDKLKGALPP